MWLSNDFSFSPLNRLVRLYIYNFLSFKSPRDLREKKRKNEAMKQEREKNSGYKFMNPFLQVGLGLAYE